MKKFSIVTLLACLCLVMMAVVSVSLIPNLKGQITLGQYKGLTVEASSLEVTGEDIEQAIELLRWEHATYTDATTNAGLYDTLTLNYVGVMDGKEEDVFSDTDRTITLGSDQFVVSGMDEHLLGANVGEPVKVTLTVPETHHAPEYIGKQVEFTLTVTAISRPVLPELTDEFVKTLGDYSSVAEFKTKFEQQYRQQAADSQSATLHNELFQMAVENATVKHYPTHRVRALMKEWYETLAAGAEDMGMSQTDYASFAYGLNSKRECDRAAMDNAQSIVKQEMVLWAIAKGENITLSDEEYDQYYATYLQAFTAEGYTEEDMLAYYGSQEELTQQFLLEQVGNYLEEQAVIQ